MNEPKIQKPGSDHHRKAKERALALLEAMMDESVSPALRSRMARWFESPDGWDAKGEALEQYADRTLQPDPAPDRDTLRAKEEFLRSVGAAPSVRSNPGASGAFGVSAVPALPEASAALRTQAHKAPLRRKTFTRSFALAAAVAVIALVSGAYLGVALRDAWFRDGAGSVVADIPAALPEPLRVVKTIGGVQKNIHLDDGTEVWLNEQSNVAYREHERRLEMQGKVWFDVAHDASTPFVVKTERMEILVHGTEFSVEQLEDRTVVRLIEGLLDVKLPSGNEARLYSGRQATLVWGTDELVVEPFGQTQDWRTEHIFINGRTMPEILRMTDNFYDVKIHFEQADFSDAREYSINLNSRQSLENVLQVLSIISNGFTFERQADGSIRIICVK